MDFIQQTNMLYKRDTTGEIRILAMEYSNTGYRTISGRMDGNKVISEWTYPEATNVGKANETTVAQQVLKEVESHIKKKKKEGYFEEIENIDTGTLIKPMLAHKFEDYSDKIVFPVCVQPKLDGIRCLVSKNGMFSRKGEQFVSCPHISDELKNFFDENPDVILDGELYNHDYRDNFNEIQSLVMKKKVEASDLAITEDKVRYYIYDFISSKGFNSRLSIMNTEFEFWSDKITSVSTELADSFEELDKIYASYLADGFEGCMVRNSCGAYENKRSKNLLKRKEFLDDEFLIVDIVEGDGNRSGMAGSVECRLKDGSASFGAGIKGGVEFNKKLLENRHLYVGKQATIRYQNLTPDGIPRFPIFINVREDI